MINRSKITVVFHKGETIRKQGTYMSHVISLNSGFAKIYLEGADLRNAIIRIVKPTNFIGVRISQLVKESRRDQSVGPTVKARKPSRLGRRNR